MGATGGLLESSVVDVVVVVDPHENKRPTVDWSVLPMFIVVFVFFFFFFWTKTSEDFVWWWVVVVVVIAQQTEVVGGEKSSRRVVGSAVQRFHQEWGGGEMNSTSERGLLLSLCQKKSEKYIFECSNLLDQPVVLV